MNEIILLKLGEVVLKGLNRRSFEDKLMSNIRRRLQHCGKFQVVSRQSTIYVEPAGEGCDMEEAYALCKRVFGVIAVTRARPCPKDKDAMSPAPSATWGTSWLRRRPSRWRPSARTSTSP